MKYLFEKLLLEEEGFEDTEVEETEGIEEKEEPTEDETPAPEITDDNLDQVVADAEGEDTSTPESTTTLYKVSFTLGKHDNWSRIEATSEEEASQLVKDYVTRKWPDRAFEVSNVEEFDEEEMKESLNESLGEVTDAQPIETGAEVGMANVISDLIKDEYEAIDGYNSAIATAEAEGFEDLVNVLTEIQAEENLHIGQLQAVMNTLDPNAHLVDDGQQEGIEQLSGDLSMDGTITEDLDDMSLQDQRMFIRCVNEIWNMSVMEWTQRYYSGQLEVTTVNSYDDIPDTSNLIEIGAVDISQGTGNVIVYTYMDAGDGSLYKYVSF